MTHTITRKSESLKKLWSITGGNIFYFLKFILADLFFRFFDVNTLVTFKLKKYKTSFGYTIRNRSDLLVVKETFLHNEYDEGLPREAQVIFDLGACIGDSAIYFSLRYPNAHIYALEPDPMNIPLLKRNTRRFPNISIHEFAVGATNETVSFYSNHKTGVSSSFIKRNAEDQEKTVAVKTLPSLMQDLGVSHIDILKFDVEGAEGDIFLTGEFPYGSVGFLIGEVHKDLMEHNINYFYNFISKFLHLKEKKVTTNRSIISGYLIDKNQ